MTTEDVRVHAGSTDRPAIPDVSRRSRILLLGCLILDAALIGWLAVWDATLTRSAWDLIGTVLLLVIAIACVLAFAAVLRRSPSALLTTIVCQTFVVCLAAYIWLVDQRSPIGQLGGVTGIALVLGAIAVFWIVFLGRFVRGTVSKSAVVVAALFPVLGLVQFWLQTDYLPRSSLPMVDVEAELTPVGNTGPIIHLAAKVKLHNRGSTKVDIPMGLVRVHTYPKGSPEIIPSPESVATFLNPSGSLIADYREVPTLPADAKLLYAGSIGSVGSFIAPGATHSSQLAIDIDSREVRLARLRISLIAVNHRTVTNPRTCFGSQVSYNENTAEFLEEAAKLQNLVGAEDALCIETPLAARGAIEELVSDHPLLRIYTVVRNDNLTTPLLIPFFGTPGSFDDLLSQNDERADIEHANPSGTFGAMSEYAPAASDLQPAN